MLGKSNTGVGIHQSKTDVNGEPPATDEVGASDVTRERQSPPTAQEAKAASYSEAWRSPSGKPLS